MLVNDSVDSVIWLSQYELVHISLDVTWPQARTFYLGTGSTYFNLAAVYQSTTQDVYAAQYEAYVGARLTVFRVTTDATSLSAMLSVELAQFPYDELTITAQMALFTDGTTDTVTAAYNYDYYQAFASVFTVDLFVIQYRSDTN